MLSGKVFFIFPVAKPLAFVLWVLKVEWFGSLLISLIAPSGNPLNQFGRQISIIWKPDGTFAMKEKLVPASNLFVDKQSS